MSNGEDMAKAVQGMTQDEKLVFLISEVGGLKMAFTAHAKVLTKAISELSNIKLELVKLPAHCQHEGDFEKMCTIRDTLDSRIDELEKESVGRKAVTKVWLGTGGMSILGISLAILKFIFEVF